MNSTESQSFMLLLIMSTPNVMFACTSANPPGLAGHCAGRQKWLSRNCLHVSVLSVEILQVQAYRLTQCQTQTSHRILISLAIQRVVSLLAERLPNETAAPETMTISPWTSRVSKLCQPDLDYIGESILRIGKVFCNGEFSLTICSVLIAPEVQLHSTICMQSDMFSLGMVITAIFNHGRPIMQANNSNTSYRRQLDMVRVADDCLCLLSD